MNDKGVQPDTYAATALVQACTKDMELAQSVFEELFGKKQEAQQQQRTQQPDLWPAHYLRCGLCDACESETLC